MKHFIFALLLIVLPLAAGASEGTLAEKLDARKAEFSEKADEQIKKEFEEGVRYVAESGVLESAKKAGDKAPDFILPNAAGENIELSALLESGPVVMIWYRGEWCPYCNIQLEDVQEHNEAFKALGAQIVAISPQLPDRGWTVQDRLDLEYHVLSDVKSKVAMAYGVAYTLPDNIAARLQSFTDLHAGNDDDSNLLPLAAAYVIGQDGVIAYAYLDGDYRKRVETTELLEQVKILQGE